MADVQEGEAANSEETNIDAFVADYLRRKGYSKAFEALQEAGVTSLEQLQEQSDEQIVNVIKYQSEDSRPTVYDSSYKAFKNWAQTSLDMYRPELLSVLYPIFIHCYLDLVERGNKTEAVSFLQKHRHDHSEKHQHEIDRLQNVIKPEHMKENELVQSFRGNKFNITMCSYSFELLLAYLHERKFVLLLSIINQYINIKVHPGQPKQRDQDELYAPISGDAEKAITTMHGKDLYWGLFEEQKKFNPKFDVEEGKQPKRQKLDDGEEAPAPDSKVSLPGLSAQAENELMEDLRKRVQLGPTALPSICCVTFFNTYDSLNKISVSRRGNLVAAGFQDSTIRLWDLEYDSSRWNRATKHYVESDGRDPKYKPKRQNTAEGEFYHLVGHSAPVFGLSFSPDSQFLLSCSEDTTVRLWNMETKTNIVCYRGHSYPVWDVQFSPLGYYFATASHDKTARVWATNHLYPLRIFAGHLSDVNCVKFHPNCNYIVTGSTDKCIRVWDINSGDCIRIFTGHYAPVYTVAISPDGRFIASAGEDKDVIIWDLASSTRIATWKGIHKGVIWSLDFSTEGDILASGSQDGTVRLWDIKTLREEVMTKEKEEEEDKLEVGAANAMDVDEGNEKEAEDDAEKESDDEDLPLAEAPEKKPAGLLETFATKKTPVLDVHFTGTNLLLASGIYKKSQPAGKNQTTST